MAFQPFPVPVRNSSIFRPVVRGTQIPLDGPALKAAIAGATDLDWLEFQLPPSTFANQPPGA